MRLKEKRPAPGLTHEAYAIERAGKWIGCYQSPRIGVRFVKNDDGQLETFDDKVYAEVIASRRLCRDLDKLAPMKVTKEFRPAPRRPKWARG
jgi:hypothetical protein